MKLILILYFLLQASLCQTITTCQQEKYLGVIGGSLFTVNSVYTTINSDSSTIAVGGLLTETDTGAQISYFYLLQSKTCQLIAQNQFTSQTNGIQAIAFSLDNNQVAMVAYSETEEYLIVVELTDANYSTWIYQTSSGWSDNIRPQSLLSVGYDQYFIVGAQQIRKVFAGGNAAEAATGPVYSFIDFNASVIKCATLTNSAIFALIQIDGTQSIVLTKLNYQLDVLESYSASNDVSTIWADNEARISSAVGPPTSTAVAACINGLTGNVLFTMYISDDSTHVVTLSTTYKTSSWAQCLGVRAKDGQNADYVLIDAASTLWFYSTNFDTGTALLRQNLAPLLTGWQSNTQSSSVLGQSFALIPAVASQILGIAQGYNVGFVRINKDADWSAGVSQQLSVDVLVTDPPPVLGQGAPTDQTYDFSVVDLKQSYLPIVQKSDWTRDFCPDIQKVQKATSQCPYYQIYDNPQAAALLDTNRTGVPKAAGLCPQGTQDLLDISVTQQPIRQVCFPLLNKLPKTIPYDNASGQYLVYQLGDYWSWPRDIKKALARNSTTISYKTFTDDKANFPGDSVSMKFAGQLVTNKVVQIKRGKNFKLALVTPSKPLKNDQYTFNISCLSKVCPGKLLIFNDTIVADSSDICGSELHGAYVYEAKLHFTVKDIYEYTTFTLNFTCPKQKSPININLPWPQWVQLNGKTSKYRPTPLTVDQDVTYDEQTAKESLSDKDFLLSDYSPQAQKVLSKWTNEQVVRAVTEAKQRKEKVAKIIRVTPKMGNTGNLRISFSNPVLMPSYLIFDKNAQGTSVQVKQNQLSPNDATANSRRRRKMKCVGGVCPPLDDEDQSAQENPDDQASMDGLSEEDLAFLDGLSEEDLAFLDGLSEEDLADLDGLSEEDQAFLDGLSDEDLAFLDGLSDSEEDLAFLDGLSEEDLADLSTDQEANEPFDEEAPVQVCDQEGQDSTSFDGQCTQEGTTPEEVPILDTLDCTLPENSNAVDCGGTDATICPFGSYFDKGITSCKKYVIYFGEWKDLIKLIIVPDPEKDYDQAMKDLAYSYQVTAASVDYIDIQIDFVNPLKVTIKDRIQFDLALGEIEPALTGQRRRLKGSAKANDVFVTTQLTPQLPKEGAQKVEAAATSVQAATIGTVVGSAALQILLSGALAQIWGMINGIQIIIYLPLLAIQFPANALMFIDKILIVACFDIPYLNMEDIYGELWVAGDDASIFNDLPNNDLLTSGMDTLGFSTRMLSANLGSVFIFMTLSFAILAFIGVLELLSRSGMFQTFKKPSGDDEPEVTRPKIISPDPTQPTKKIKKTSRIRFRPQTLELQVQPAVITSEPNQPPTEIQDPKQTESEHPILVQPSLSKPRPKSANRGYRLLQYLKKKFLWNYYIRLFFECCLELIISTWLGVMYGHFWNPQIPIPVTGATVICFALSAIWFVVTAGLPLFILFFYLYNWRSVKDETFESKFNCVYEGLKTESKLALVYPIYFVVRRCCLLITVITCYQFIWLQIMVNLFFCFFIILFVYLQWPFEDDRQNKLEIMNEVTTVLLLYIVYMFSDLIPDPETTYMVGYFYIVILVANLSVHLTLIGKGIYADLVEKIKGWHQACKEKQKKGNSREVGRQGIKQGWKTFKFGKIRINQDGAEETKPQESSVQEPTSQIDSASQTSWAEKKAENSQLEAEEQAKRIDEIKIKFLKQEQRNVRYLHSQFKKEQNFDASQGMCFGKYHNKKGVRLIMLFDMICFPYLVRFLFAFRAYRNMEDHFNSYVRVRLVTSYLQTTWLILNLVVGIYNNVWGDATVSSSYIICGSVFVIAVALIDFHFTHCVLFLRTHKQRLDDKSEQDEEKIRYAYQMDPTSAEYIEEQKEKEQLKPIQQDQTTSKLDVTAKLEDQLTTLIQSKIEISTLIKRNDLSLSSSSNSDSDKISQILEDQECQELATFRLVKWQGTRVENDSVMTQMVLETTQRVPLTDLQQIPNQFLKLQSLMAQQGGRTEQSERDFIDSKIDKHLTIKEEIKENPRDRQTKFNEFVAKIKNRQNIFLPQDFVDLLPDDFTEESDGYQESALQNLLVMFSDLGQLRGKREATATKVAKPEHFDQEINQIDFQMDQSKQLFKMMPVPFPERIKKIKLFETRNEYADLSHDNEQITERQQKSYRSCLDDSDQD